MFTDVNIACSPGYVIASLAVKGPHELSGQFLNWNADELASYQKPSA
jgi:hypothetical protein